MPAFNIRKIESQIKCGIKEEKIRNIIEDSFPVADVLDFYDVSTKISKGLKNLGYNFNVYVAENISACLHSNGGISIVYKDFFIRYVVKYCGELKMGCGYRTTPGQQYLVIIWN